MRCSACLSCAPRDGRCGHGGPYRHGPAVAAPVRLSPWLVCATCGALCELAPYVCPRRGLVARARYHTDAFYGGPDVEFCSAACRTNWRGGREA